MYDLMKYVVLGLLAESPSGTVAAIDAVQTARHIAAQLGSPTSLTDAVVTWNHVASNMPGVRVTPSSHMNHVLRYDSIDVTE